MAAGKRYRVVAIGDLHCGHYAGLTPPRWQVDAARLPGIAALQRECWQWYAAQVRALAPVDVLIVNGDMIDGKGEATGARECITADREEQCEIAVACLRQWRPRLGSVCVYGTGYHTGRGEDWERVVAERIGAPIHAHTWPEVGGVVFDCKHKVGASSVPHGRATALNRARLWNQLWAEHDRQPRGTVLLRSHVHYHQYTGGPGWLAMTLPALQAAQTIYGARECEGVVDYGVTWYDCQQGEVVAWRAEIVRLQAERSHVLRFAR